jgi:hypothetical protein
MKRAAGTSPLKEQKRINLIQNPRVLFKANSNLMNSNLPANHHFGFSSHEPGYFSLGALGQ